MKPWLMHLDLVDWKLRYHLVLLRTLGSSSHPYTGELSLLESLDL